MQYHELSITIRPSGVTEPTELIRPIKTGQQSMVVAVDATQQCVLAFLDLPESKLISFRVLYKTLN